MGTVEDGDLPFGGDFFVNAPQEIVVQFLSSGFFEGYYVQPLRIHPGEDMLDAAVLAPCIHSLKNNQNFVLVLGKKFFCSSCSSSLSLSNSIRDSSLVPEKRDLSSGE